MADERTEPRASGEAPEALRDSAVARAAAASRMPRRRLVLCAAVVGATAAVVVALGIEAGLGPAATAVLVALAAGGALAGVMILALRRLERDYLQPMQLLLGTLEGLRGSRADASEPPAVGAPLVQVVARAISDARLAVRRRERASQADLLSVEAAFERLHAVLQALNEAVLLADWEGVIVLANSAARRLLRDDLPGPIEGRSLLDSVAGELRDKLGEALGQIREGDERLFQLAGVPIGARYFDLAVAEARSQTCGQSFGIVVSLVDVTRNHEIAQLKDEFLSSISHELRTPLTNICAFAELLGQVGPDNDTDWNEFLAIVNTESQRLQRLVEDLLEHGRLQRGEMGCVPGDVDVGAVASQVVESLQRRADRGGLRLEIESGGGSLRARADENRLRQVLARLLDNAVKFTPPGGRVRVTVSALEEAVEVAVADSGEGVPAEHRETVFERFRQVGGVLTDKPTGAGLGLAICRGLVDAMHGALWCEESELGGACFRFVLPSLEAASLVTGDADDASTIAELARDFVTGRGTASRQADHGGCWRIDADVGEDAG